MSSEYCCDKCAEESKCLNCGDREVKESQNGFCVPCWNEMFTDKKPMSYESNNCPGCDEELTVQANGYCASCWIERFGCEDLSPISWKDDEEDYVESVIKIQKWWRNVHRSQKIRCDGCYFNVLNQQGHMGIGGCLYEPDHYEKY